MNGLVMQEVDSLETRQYVLLKEVMACGSMSLAAERLGYSQSQVSRMVQEAERAVGFPIFRREGRGVRVTEAGSFLIHQYEAVLIAATTTLRDARKIHEGLSGTLRLGYTTFNYGHCLFNYLADLRAAFPQLSVELVRRRSDLLAEQLERGELDLGFLNPPIGNREIALQAEFATPLAWALPGSAASVSDVIDRLPMVVPPISQWPALHARLQTVLSHHGWEIRMWEQSVDAFDSMAYVASGIAYSLLPAGLERLAGGAIRFEPMPLTVPSALASQKRPAPLVKNVIARVGLASIGHETCA
ncbi:MAG: LysR family transcriptional regulator [Fimbriimonadaceae bacterium]|nr:LysR family transcriptional regulator [Fimbriimonadaceae bacterium]